MGPTAVRSPTPAPFFGSPFNTKISWALPSSTAEATPSPTVSAEAFLTPFSYDFFTCNAASSLIEDSASGVSPDS